MYLYLQLTSDFVIYSYLTNCNSYIFLRVWAAINNTLFLLKCNCSPEYLNPRVMQNVTQKKVSKYVTFLAFITSILIWIKEIEGFVYQVSLNMQSSTEKREPLFGAISSQFFPLNAKLRINETTNGCRLMSPLLKHLVEVFHPPPSRTLSICVLFLSYMIDITLHVKGKKI